MILQILLGGPLCQIIFMVMLNVIYVFIVLTFALMVQTLQWSNPWCFMFSHKSGQWRQTIDSDVFFIALIYCLNKEGKPVSSKNVLDIV